MPRKPKTPVVDHKHWCLSNAYATVPGTDRYGLTRTVRRAACTCGAEAAAKAKRRA